MYQINTLPASCFFYIVHIQVIFPPPHRMSQRGQYIAYVASSHPSIWQVRTRVTFPRKGVWQSTWIHEPPMPDPNTSAEALKTLLQGIPICKETFDDDDGRHPSSELRARRSISTYKCLFSSSYKTFWSASSWALWAFWVLQTCRLRRTTKCEEFEWHRYRLFKQSCGILRRNPAQHHADRFTRSVHFCGHHLGHHLAASRRLP